MILVVAACASGCEHLNVLTLNLRNSYDVPSGSDVRVVWRDRYARLAQWVKGSGNVPDVIALQETPGWWWCPFFTALPDYDAIYHLISTLNSESGESYRLAYLVGTTNYGGQGGNVMGPTQLAGCHGWGGLGLLYNENRLRNVTGQAQDNQVAHDDVATIGVHFRRSLPCCNPRDASVCSLVDGPLQTDKCGRATGAGLTWVATSNTSANTPRAIAAFARFELRQRPGKYIHVYNVHFVDPQPSARSRANDLISALESRFSSSRLFPPIILGDFNGGVEQFDVDFIEAGNNDVDYVLVGHGSRFSAAYGVTYTSLDLPPGPDCDPAALDPAVLWSDHCAVYVHFESRSNKTDRVLGTIR